LKYHLELAPQLAYLEAVLKPQMVFESKSPFSPPSLKRAMARQVKKREVTPKWNTKADEHFEEDRNAAIGHQMGF
jgi:hypothetical protein